MTVVVYMIGGWLLVNAVVVLTIGVWRLVWNRRMARSASGLLPSAEPYLVGEGDVAVLFVHGFNDVPFLWRRLVDNLSSVGMTCRAMRLPGAGDTVGVGRLDDLRRAVRSEIEALAEKHRRVCLVGHSLGGALSLDAVLSGDNAARLVSDVVLIAPLIEVSRAHCPVLSPYFYYRLVRLLCPCMRYLPSVFKETLSAEDDADFVYSRDRFVHISWYDSVFALVERLRGVADAPLGLPVLAFTAGLDRVVDSCATEDWCRRHGIAVRNVENATHPIPLCRDWQDVAAEIREWILRGSGSASDRIRYVDSVTEGLCRLGNRISGKRTRVARGAILVVNLSGVIEHSGVYLGNNCVAEVYNDNGTGRMVAVPLWQFLFGKPGQAVRHGDCIYAACNADDESLGHEGIALAAERFMREIGTVDYSILGNNCHLFTMSCVIGRYQPEKSFFQIIKDGGYSVGELSNVVKRWLNAGKEVSWIPAENLNEALGINDPDLSYNVSWQTMGGEWFWNDIEDCDGWRIQEWKTSILWGHYRLLDPRNCRRAWGRGKKALAALRRMLGCIRACKAECRCSERDVNNRREKSEKGSANSRFHHDFPDRTNESNSARASFQCNGTDEGRMNWIQNCD